MTNAAPQPEREHGEPRRVCTPTARPASIARRLNALFLAILAVVLVAVGAWVATAIEGHFQEQDRMEISGKLELVARALAQVRTPEALSALPQQLDDALVGHHAMRVEVADGAGATLYASHGTPLPAGWREAPTPYARIDRAAFLFWEDHGIGYRGLVAAIPTGIDGSAPLVVGVALDIAHHQQFIVALRNALVPALVVCLVLAGVLTSIATRRGLAPLRDMAAVAKGISASRLDQRLAVERVPAELVDLATSFNGMLARLEESFRRLQEFSADIAHDLRTPIGNLLMQTQVALSRVRAPEDYREILHSALEEYERLARMISDMLFLAKADNGRLIPDRERLDLAVEVDALCEFFEPLASERGVRLRRLGQGSISGDRLMLRRAIGNLLSNALAHTPHAGVVRVEIDTAQGGVRVAVENPGTPIPVEHLSRVFDRFHRIDPARQGSRENAGLGLAIARSIVAAHGGRIEALPRPDGARFEMTLPA